MHSIHVRERVVRFLLLALLLTLLALSALQMARGTLLVGSAPAAALACNGGSQGSCGGG